MWVAVFAIAMLTTVVANGQLSGKGAITGTVTDRSGAVIANAEVSAKNDATGISTSTKTTGAGDYNLSNLDPGIYTITTTAEGFETLTQMNVHVNAMESQAYSPTLIVGAASIDITVTDQPPQLDTTNATLGATMENETYAELPIEMGAYGNADQRRATDFVYLMPGVQGNETNGNATTNVGVVNGSGSKGAASAVYVDGVVFVRAGGNGDPRYVWTAISVDAIDQFQVQTNGYSAVYEGQGVMNYTVKQGGAKQHGSVYEFFRNTALDTWGFWGKAPNPATGVPVKPVEHSNEYGINLGGPLIPFGGWKNKVFYYANYNGFRYSSATPTPITFPTPAQQQGDFSAVVDSNNKLIPIYDPSSQAACTANSIGFCRYQYGYGPPPAGTTKVAGGTPTKVGPLNVIPTGASGAGVRFDGSKTSEISPVAAAMQALLPQTGISSALQNNYIAPNATGLTNWSTTDRIDYLVTSKDTLSLIAAIGRQASSNPVGQTTAGRNVGPVPFNYGQTYAPKTAVGIIEETHLFTPHVINQAKWGYARYNGPTFNPDQSPAYAATAMGIGNLQAGQAQQTFPIVPFAGTNAPTGWGGTIANLTLAENYTALDNLQWTVGKHSFTFGGQVAWMLYNTYSATGAGATTPFVLASAVTETAGLAKPGSYTVASGTGLAYASFLLGQIDSTTGKNAAGSTFTYTDYSAHPGYGARFRAISPYFQDNWKITSNLTLDLGLRWDYFPSVTEVKNDASFFDPTLVNPVTGLTGALNFTGHGAGTCNCSTPVQTSRKNIGPRLGVAYQLNPKTVIRSSYGIMFTHGDAVGGNASTLGTLGFSNAPSMSSANDATAMTGLLNSSALDTNGNPITGAGLGAVPSYAPPLGVASGAGYGTGNYIVSKGVNSPSPSTFNYDDPYLGSRAPEYINWSLGIQRQLTNALALSATYVGSEGHFLQLDSSTARGIQSNQLDPKYLVLGSHLGDTGASTTTVTTDCGSGGAVVTNGLSCNATALSLFATNQPLSTLLKPYPFQTVSDSFGYVGNANYHSLQVMANMRAWKGLTFNANYAWSRAIDDGGTFRTGYAIPAGTLANHPNLSYPADRIERTVSTSNQPQHFVLTTVWDWPFGKTVLAEKTLERAILGGFKFSGIYQAYSGSPLAITESSAQTNPAQSSTAPPILNHNFSGPVRQNGKKWGKGVVATPNLPNSYNAVSFITPSTGTTIANAAGPFMNPVSTMLSSFNYQFSDAPRTAPYGLTGPGNYQLDLAMVRSFPLHFTESAKLDFRAEWYNVTNHTLFAVASTAVGNASFGQVTASPVANRKAAQFAARIEF
jgi:hypothetical protein